MRGGGDAGRGSGVVPSITSARPPLREDVHRRTSRYLLSMAIRTACVVLAVVTSGWLRWVFLAGAILLPYLAVVLANAGRERSRPPDAVVDPRAITAGPTTAPTAGPGAPEGEADEHAGR